MAFGNYNKLFEKKNLNHYFENTYTVPIVATYNSLNTENTITMNVWVDIYNWSSVVSSV